MIAFGGDLVLWGANRPESVERHYTFNTTSPATSPSSFNTIVM
jgi:hypothetical protein